MCDHITLNGARCRRRSYCAQHKRQPLKKRPTAAMTFSLNVHSTALGRVLAVILLSASTVFVAMFPNARESTVASYPSASSSNTLTDFATTTDPSFSQGLQASLLNPIGVPIPSEIHLNTVGNPATATGASFSGLPQGIASTQIGAERLINFDPSPIQIPPSATQIFSGSNTSISGATSWQHRRLTIALPIAWRHHCSVTGRYR